MARNPLSPSCHPPPLVPPASANENSGQEDFKPSKQCGSGLIRPQGYTQNNSTIRAMVLACRNMNTLYRGAARPKGRIMVSAPGKAAFRAMFSPGRRAMQSPWVRRSRIGAISLFHSTLGALTKGIQSMRQQIFALPCRLCYRLLCMLLESSMRKSALGAPQNIRKLIRTGRLLGHFRAYFL